jgi:hypothetical protein
MLAADVGVDAARVHAQVLAQQVSEAGSVQYRSRAEYAVRGQARQPDGGAGEHVHRVRGDDDDPLRVGRGHARHDLAEDLDVALDQVQARLALLLPHACGNDGDGRALGV